MPIDILQMNERYKVKCGRETDISTNSLYASFLLWRKNDE